MRFPQRFEATMSRADFLRLLPAAVGDESYEDRGAVLIGSSGWRIAVHGVPPLEVGALRLERITVDIELPDWPRERADAFMRRFAAYFQRGGG